MYLLDNNPLLPLLPLMGKNKEKKTTKQTKNKGLKFKTQEFAFPREKDPWKEVSNKTY